MSGPPRWGSETDDRPRGWGRVYAWMVALVCLSGAVLLAQGALYPTGPDTPITCYLTSAATTNATICKASPGNVYGYSLMNTTATVYYLRMYNLAVPPTCSSATGFVESIPIPASTSGAGVQRVEPNGQSLSNTSGTSTATAAGIGFCLTAGGSSTDNSSAATGVYISLRIK